MKKQTAATLNALALTMALSAIGITAKPQKVAVDAQQQEKLSKEFFQEIASLTTQFSEQLNAYKKKISYSKDLPIAQRKKNEEKIDIFVAQNYNQKIIGIINTAVTQGLDVNATNQYNMANIFPTVLSVAIMSQDPTILQSLLKKGIQPHNTDLLETLSTVFEKIQENPFHISESGERLVAIATLLARNTKNVNSVDNEKMTPLAYAIHLPFTNTLELITVLLEKGANPNTQDSYGQPVLVTAAYNKDKNIVALLLKKGADSNAQNTHGETALMMAALGDKDMVKLLLDKDADTTLKNKDGQTALHFANELLNRIKSHPSIQKKYRAKDIKEIIKLLQYSKKEK